MSAPIMAHGVSIPPSPDGRHVILGLHDQAGAPVAYVLMTPVEAETVVTRLTVSTALIADDGLGTMPSRSVN